MGESASITPELVTQVALSQSTATTEQILKLAQQLSVVMKSAAGSLNGINNQVRMLSFNASIEAARAGGEAGAAFQVVASGMRSLSEKTEDVSYNMQKDTASVLEEIESLSLAITTDMRSARLLDAINGVTNQVTNYFDGIGRDINIISRSVCVQGFFIQGMEDHQRACRNNLRSWIEHTPHLVDIWILDTMGEVIYSMNINAANTVGLSFADEPWFREARSTISRKNQKLQAPQMVEILGNRVIQFVCEPVFSPSNGDLLGYVVMALDAHGALSPILEAVQLAAHERPKTSIYLLDSFGQHILSTRFAPFSSEFWLPGIREIILEDQSVHEVNLAGKSNLVLHAKTPDCKYAALDLHLLLVQDHSEVSDLRNNVKEDQSHFAAAYKTYNGVDETELRDKELIAEHTDEAEDEPAA